MQETVCPLCWTPLEVVDTTPCFDCGALPNERGHLEQRKHTYSEFSAFGIPIILCNFCAVDFSSYDPAYFNLPPRTKLGLGDSLLPIQQIEHATMQKDKFCPQCHRRLAFLRFVKTVREAQRL